MARAPRLLALDSSADGLAIAACRGDEERSWHGPGGSQASTRLLPQARRLLDELGLVPTALQAIAWACGPGAFTGLRSAGAVAQGLAFGAGLPVLSIDSLLLVAEAARVRRVGDGAATIDDRDGLTVAVAVDARMGELYAARYRHVATGWQTLDAPGLWTPPALQAAWRDAPPAVLAGSGLPLLSPAPAGRVVATSDADRAAALLRLARAAWVAGEATQPEAALPIYVRDRVALTTAERAAAARAPAP